jgi:HAE1 family hydrophobic/amphiphilic exporter-1
MIMVANLMSDNPLYDETFLQNYAKINFIPQIQRVNGVGQAMVFGSKDYSMRIWLKPDRLTAYGLSVQEVLTAVREQNLEAAPGRLGENSHEAFEYVIKYRGKFNKDEQYGDIILRANADGSVLRLRDVARVELGSFSYNQNTTVNGKQGIGLAIFQTAGSNANDIQTEVNALLEKAKADLPQGVQVFTIYSTKEYLDESIKQVTTKTSARHSFRPSPCR